MRASTSVTAAQIESTTVLEREREIRLIGDAIERARTGAGTAILVEGEAGIGKSTLALQAVAEDGIASFAYVSSDGFDLPARMSDR